MKKTMDNGQWTMSKRRTAGLVLAIVFFVHGPLSIAHAYAFTRNLSLGAQGEDVRQLQIVLNSNPQTQVSYSGVGSPGQETDYFGEKTHAAVVRYQNLYASKILAPLGLSSGTGFVGASTRALLTQGGVGTAYAPTPAYVAPAKPVLTSVSPSRGGVGTVVTLTGTGFLPTGNKVSSVFEEFTNLPSSNGTTLTFTINGPFPKAFLDMNKAFYEEHNAEMNYDFVVSNSTGASAALPFRFMFY